MSAAVLCMACYLYGYADTDYTDIGVGYVAGPFVFETEYQLDWQYLELRISWRF